jgi:hypothetical protein
MLSTEAVLAPTSTASQRERISTNRRLSRFDEKSDGVRPRVEMRASQVIAKFAITYGRVLISGF